MNWTLAISSSLMPAGKLVKISSESQPDLIYLVIYAVYAILFTQAIHLNRLSYIISMI